MSAFLKTVRVSSHLVLHPYSHSNRREEKPLKVAEKNSRNHELVGSQVWRIAQVLGKTPDNTGVVTGLKKPFHRHWAGGLAIKYIIVSSISP